MAFANQTQSIFVECSGRAFVAVVFGLAPVCFRGFCIPVDCLDYRAWSVKHNGGAEQLLQPLAANRWAGDQVAPPQIDEQGSGTVNAAAVVDDVVQLLRRYIALGAALEHMG